MNPTLKAYITQGPGGTFTVELHYPVHLENPSFILPLGHIHSAEALKLANELYKNTDVSREASVAAACGGFYTVKFFNISKKQITDNVNQLDTESIALSGMFSVAPDHVREFLGHIYTAICKMASTSTTIFSLQLHWATLATKYKEAWAPINSEYALNNTLDTILV